MNNFCQTCHNLLTFDSDGERTIKKCQMCNKAFDTIPIDSLRYQKNKESDISTRVFELANQEKDPTNKKIRCACNVCGHEFARQVRTKTMVTFVICIDCGNINPYQGILSE